MKNYSFSNIAAEDSYTRKSNDLSSCYRHSELKAAEANQRIEEIKKKYDTPSRRERIQSLKKSRDFCVGNKNHTKQDTKQNQPHPREDYPSSKDNFSHHRQPPTFGHNPLKQSFAVNRLEKSALKNDINSKQLDCIRGNDIDYHRRSQDQKQTTLYSMKSRSREDEEVLFSKVREMKESIINNDYMRGSINQRTSISSAKYSQLPDSKPDPSRKFDPRVENIDKINAKIKQILSCLAQNQKKQPKFQKDSPSSLHPKDNILPSTKIDNTPSSYLRSEKSSSKYQNIKESAVFGAKTRQLQETSFAYKNRFSNNAENIPKESFIQTKSIKIPESSPYVPSNSYKHNEQKNISCFKPESQSNPYTKLTSESQKIKTRQYREYSVGKIDSYLMSQGISSKKQQQLIKTPTYINSRHLQNKGLRTSQSRSQIDSIRKSAITDNQKSDVLKSGKKLNDEISKIQKKIEQFEAQKKKLNIQFTPFSMKNRSSSNLVAGARFAPSTEVVKKPNEQVPSTAPYFRNSISTRQIKLNSQASSGVNDKKTSKERQYSNQQTNKSIDYLEVSIIEQRKRRKSTQQIILKSAYLKKFVQLFRLQVSLDVAFRDMKMWLKPRLSSSTYQNISQLLKKEGFNYSQKEIESIFKVTQSQFDPLYDDQKKGTIQSVVKSYLQAANHWSSKIKKQFNRDDLASRQFKEYIGLLDKKIIELPEFAQILSQSQITCYKTRDVDAIFRRISKGDRLQIESIIQQLCSL